MNAVDQPPQSATGFWSIERFVAFILGPAVTAGSTWLSAFLASKLGVKLSSDAIIAAIGVGGLSGGGLAYKWLHGRQIEMTVRKDLAPFETGVAGVLGEGFIKTTVHDLEGLAQSAASHAVAAVTKQPTVTKQPMNTAADLSPPDVPIPPAANDPAPSGQAADEGAAGPV